MTKLRIKASRYHAATDRFMHQADLLTEGSHICEKVTISMSTEKEVNSEYLEALKKHIEKMDVDGYRYTDIRIVSVMKQQ